MLTTHWSGQKVGPRLLKLVSTKHIWQSSLELWSHFRKLLKIEKLGILWIIIPNFFWIYGSNKSERPTINYKKPQVWGEHSLGGVRGRKNLVTQTDFPLTSVTNVFTDRCGTSRLISLAHCSKCCSRYMGSLHSRCSWNHHLLTK